MTGVSRFTLFAAASLAAAAALPAAELTLEPDLRELAENRAVGFKSSYRTDAKYADGVLKLDHSNPQNAYAAIHLADPRFLKPGRKIEAGGEIRVGAPAKAQDASFMIVFVFPGAPKNFWAASARFVPGCITLPDGQKIETKDDFVKFDIAFDPADGMITLTADGKTVSGKAGTISAKGPGIFFGDGSNGISGSAEIKSIRFRTAAEESAENALPSIEPDLKALAENRAVGFRSSYRTEATYADGVLKLNHNHPQNAWPAIHLVDPRFLNPGSCRIEASGELRVGEPAKPEDASFMIVFVFPGAPKNYWAANVRFVPGCITLPDGQKIETQRDFVKFTTVFDPDYGTITLTADGKSISGKAGSLPAKEPGIFFGDGSSGISGSAELKSIRFRLL